ncbi:hypothetical protein I7I53_02120 [Histoplasma capsulatum var. duboisii H88]|uniref:Uncharacterized protein n=1 Tax=Ajellomyces capsulatus (strain H88) TaxID=544711 RepID=A0A8A1LQ39_AJEC8|nr:hypothetical protein I7I53_02120 [Histoplasma capsulatum var. duboisii H88]
MTKDRLELDLPWTSCFKHHPFLPKLLSTQHLQHVNDHEPGPSSGSVMGVWREAGSYFYRPSYQCSLRVNIVLTRTIKVSSFTTGAFNICSSVPFGDGSVRFLGSLISPPPHSALEPSSLRNDSR